MDETSSATTGYEPPKLVELGPIEELTLNGVKTGPNSDGDGSFLNQI